MNTNELISKITGVDERRRTKSSITLTNLMFHTDTEMAEELNTITLNKPSIEIERHGNFVQLEICFVSSMDQDLRALWNNFEYYGRQYNDMTSDIANGDKVPICSLTIVPIALEGQYHATALNPVFWALTSKKIGQNSNIIRLLYNLDDINFYQDEGIDMEDIKDQAKKEVMAENREKAAENRAAELRRMEMSNEVDGFDQQ
jgi:hypothetical protein